ncbi:MAG: formylmethanofuran dehydrogenase [Candidatus Methanomethylicota archaeon]|nr:MAG: formylmethanofuran dehydrogenase [Candidatus Verstraetearchaeota archaeon]
MSQIRVHADSPRREIEKLIMEGDLETLLCKAAELHGHFCPYLAYGVLAGYIAMKELGIKNTGMEEIIAIVETNNCFSDGVQIVTGCTFGNNALIFKDLGKTAVTVARRDGRAVRISLNPDFEESRVDKYPEAYELWNKIVVRREDATVEERRKLMQLFAEMAFEELKQPAEKMFRIKHIKIKVPEYSPIFSSLICSICGEKVMEPKARVKDGKPICLECAGGEYYLMDGRGISVEKADRTVD